MVCYEHRSVSVAMEKYGNVWGRDQKIEEKGRMK